MKRKNERVPGFDEVIFRDRNKEYGAFELRKSYNRTLGISLLGGLALAAILVLLPSLTLPKKGDIKNRPLISTVQSDGIADEALRALQEEKKPAAETIDPKRYLAPDVVANNEAIANAMPVTDELLDNIKNGDPTEISPGAIDDTSVLPPEPPVPFLRVEQMPEFPGGEIALLRFISDNLVYPQEAIENRLQGKITIRFVVAATGSVEDVKVMASQGTGLDLTILEKEAMRVVGMLPVFRPGKQGGVPVPVYYTVPVTFKMN
jgi:periplasmic protein TonB